MALLELTDLRAGYGRAEVIHGVDFTVPEGSTVVLLGANGAGKTTLLKAIAGLVPISAGELRFRQQRMTRSPAYERARRGICLIPEGRGIFRSLSVRENLAVHAGRRGARDAVEQAASVFPILGERADQVAGTLSGGEQQMLALARAFLKNAPLVLADELSMGLAPVVVDQLFDAIGVLRHEGRSVLLVEQFVERAVSIADYVYILHKGTVVFAGEPAECTSGAVFERYLAGAV